jgi:Protein-tyrosine phosphatase
MANSSSGSGEASVWQLAKTGAAAPTERCYWVVDDALLGGAYPSYPEPEKQGERVRALWRAGIRTFISLLEVSERSPSGAQLVDYLEPVRTLSDESGEPGRCLQFQIEDVSIPTAELMRTILDAIDVSLAANRPVYVHCMGGIGRTGTMMGCWLLRHRLANKATVLDVIARLRQADVARRDAASPETEKQRQMVLDWRE